MGGTEGASLGRGKRSRKSPVLAEARALKALGLRKLELRAPGAGVEAIEPEPALDTDELNDGLCTRVSGDRYGKSAKCDAGVGLADSSWGLRPQGESKN